MTNKQNRTEPKLHEAYADHFLIGAAVNPWAIRNQEGLLAHHVNSITAENEMKFERLHPEPNRYTFEQADELVAFAKKHGMKMRGHTLVWHNQTTDWLFEDEAGNLVDKETLFARTKEHIHTVVGRYKDAIYTWDVVNEVIADEGDQLLRQSKWTDITGDEFIARAFHYAHEADPEAQLYYNDYNESLPHKREKIYTLLKSLLDQGVPVHGMGMQAHWNIYGPSVDDIRAAIERYASLGLRLQLTELDVSMFAHDDRRTDLKEPTAEMLRLQEARYEEIFKLLVEYRDVIDGVTFWGIADDFTWLDDFPVRGRKNWPFVFDTQQHTKSSFWKLIEATQL